MYDYTKAWLEAWASKEPGRRFHLSPYKDKAEVVLYQAVPRYGETAYIFQTILMISEELIDAALVLLDEDLRLFCLQGPPNGAG